MIVQVINTTDKKYIGDTFDTDEDVNVSSDGIQWHPEKFQDLGGGYYRYSNSNYVVEVKDITNG